MESFEVIMSNVSKKELQFKNGRFRAIFFSDLHAVVNFDRRLLRDIDAILTKYEPDVVIFNGDQVWRDASESEEALFGYLKELDACVTKHGIPWAHTFGNHDMEGGCTTSAQQEVYLKFENCLSKRSPEGVEGVMNYVLPVKSTDGTRTAFALWGLDSGRGFHEFLNAYGVDTSDKFFLNMPDPLHLHQGYDAIRFSQQMWYWQESERLEKENGEKVPGVMFFHIPLPEFTIPYRNVMQTKYNGIRREAVGCAPVNTGLFTTIIQRGDVKTVICGHDHINDYEGTYLGIKLAYDGGISYDNYCDDDIRGGRIVDVDENDPWNIKTYMVRASDCVENYPGEEMRYALNG